MTTCVRGDIVDEYTEYVVLSVSDGNGHSASTTVGILDEDPAPTLTAGGWWDAEGKDVDVWVTASHPTAKEHKVKLRLKGVAEDEIVTAEKGPDFADVTVTWDSEEGSGFSGAASLFNTAIHKSAKVPLVADDLDEGFEKFLVTAEVLEGDFIVGYGGFAHIAGIDLRGDLDQDGDRDADDNELEATKSLIVPTGDQGVPISVFKGDWVSLLYQLDGWEDKLTIAFTTDNTTAFSLTGGSSLGQTTIDWGAKIPITAVPSEIYVKAAEDASAVEANITAKVYWSTGAEAYAEDSLKIRNGSSDADDAGDVTVTAFGWENGHISFLIQVSEELGDLTSAQLDLDNDGSTDLATTSADFVPGGALLMFRPVQPLVVDPGDNGQFQGTAVVKTTSGLSISKLFNIAISNVLPEIIINSPERVEPFTTFGLSLGVNDPGDDVVQVASVDWGDGFVQTFDPSGTVSHSYSLSGQYTILVMVSDEDGVYTADHLINVGNQNAPSQPTNDATIVYSAASLMSNGDAYLNVTALDYSGEPVVEYHWDLDLDGIDDVSGTPNVAIHQALDFYTYSAILTVVDAFGHSTVFQFGFTQLGLVAGPAPNVNNYRTNFINLTPDMPADWQVHHTLQVGRVEMAEGTVEPILAKRFWKKKGINVHDVQHLRGLPKNVHAEITGLQTRFWNDQVRRFSAITGFPYTKEMVMRVIDLNLVMAESARQGAMVEYHSHWISAGRDQADEVKRITNSVQSAKRAMRWTLDKGKRLKKMGYVALGSLAFWDLIDRSVGLAQDIGNNETPSQRQQIEQIAIKLEDILNDYDSNGVGATSKLKLQHLVDLMSSWLASHNSISEGDVAKLKTILYAKIDTMPLQ